MDHYKFTITTGGTITLSLTTLPANYNLRLLNSAGTTLVTSSNSGTTNETINYTAAAGVYYARVYGTNSSTFNATTCYTLKVALGTATKPTDYVLGNSAFLEVFPNPVQQLLNINLKAFEGGSTIQLYDVNGTQVMSKKSNHAKEQLNVSTLPSGIYLIKVINRDMIISRTPFIKQ